MLPRAVHPGAWWLWGLGLMAAASRTTHVVVLGLLIVAAALVVQSRRTAAPWSGTFAVMLRVAAVIVLLRVVLQAVLAPETGLTVVLTLPSARLPDWVAGIRLGGTVTREALAVGFAEGLRLATVILAIAAAASLASPARLLRALPSALYEIGVSIVVALTFLPHLIADLQRVRVARRLRGRPVNGPRALAATAATILESALDRSITLAASMDSRGYGRIPPIPVRQRRLMHGLLLGGLLGITLGAYALLDAGTPGRGGAAVLAVGILAAVAGLGLGGRTRPRSRHRRDPWQAPEWLVSGAGIAAAALVVIDAPAWPDLGPLTLMAAVLAASPAISTPPPATATQAVIA